MELEDSIRRKLQTGGQHLLFGGTFWESLILQLSSVKHKFSHKSKWGKFWEQGDSADDTL